MNEHTSPTPAQREAEAKARKAESEAKAAQSAEEKAKSDAKAAQSAADKAEFEAAKAKWGALLPDLSKITQGKLDTAGNQLVPSALSFAAMDDAVQKLVKEYQDKIRGSTETPRKILITSTTDVASEALNYLEINVALEALEKIAAAAIQPKRQAQGTESISVLAAASAVSSQIPALISMLQVSRTVTTVSIAENDLAAIAAVIQGVRDDRTTFVHDQCRIVPKGRTFDRVQDLLQRREGLISLRASTDDVGRTKLDQIVQAIDSFVLSLAVPSTTGARTPLAGAMLYDQLYSSNTPLKPEFTHVMLIKSQGGRGQQVVSDLPLWSKDKLFLMAEVAITFLLFETESGTVCVSGTVSGRAQEHYEIGASIGAAKPPKRSLRSFFVG